MSGDAARPATVDLGRLATPAATLGGSASVIAALTAAGFGPLEAVLGGAVVALAVLVYRGQQETIGDLEARIATLEGEAREAVRAKDEEIRQWRAIAQTQHRNQEPRP